MNNKNFEYVDFLRGLAIFLVIINHIPHNDHLINSDTPNLLKYLSLFGTYGVQLFYLMSAFTLFNSLDNRKEDGFLNFFIRRFFRVAPLLYLGMCLHISYGFINSEYINFANIFLNLTFLNNLIPPSNDLVLGGSTIATEMNFYLALPLIYMFYKKKNILNLLIIIFVIHFILNKIFKFFEISQFGSINFYRTIFVQIYIFILGILLYQIIKQKLSIKQNSLNIMMIICSIIFLAFTSKDQPQFFYFKNLIIISNLLFLISFLIIKFNKYIQNNIIFKLVCSLGKVSFSAYVFHWLVIDLLKKYFPIFKLYNLQIIMFIFLAVFITYFVSRIGYVYELFFINIGKKIIKIK